MTDPAASQIRENRLGLLSSPLGAARAMVGGVLMGIANMIPGISGGTMILAMGLYTEFIDCVADVTRFRLSLRRVAFLGVVGASAGTVIFGFAALILFLLVHVAMVVLTGFRRQLRAMTLGN